MEIVLTAHPTQVNRRTLQHKHTRIATLLAQVGGARGRAAGCPPGRDLGALLCSTGLAPMQRMASIQSGAEALGCTN